MPFYIMHVILICDTCLLLISIKTFIYNDDIGIWVVMGSKVYTVKFLDMNLFIFIFELKLGNKRVVKKHLNGDLLPSYRGRVQLQ